MNKNTTLNINRHVYGRAFPVRLPAIFVLGALLILLQGCSNDNGAEEEDSPAPNVTMSLKSGTNPVFMDNASIYVFTHEDKFVEKKLNVTVSGNKLFTYMPVGTWNLVLLTCSSDISGQVIQPPYGEANTFPMWKTGLVAPANEFLSQTPAELRYDALPNTAIIQDRSTGTKLMSASGHIKNPGVYEIELGMSVDEFFNSDEYCGGMLDDRPLKAVIPGGCSVPILPPQYIFKTANGEDRLLSYESLSDGGFVTGSSLGSGGFIVYNDTACIVRNTWNFSRFFHHESCGQCSPCREGTGWMDKILHRIETGFGREEDIDLLWSIQSKIEGNTICPLGDAASWPVAAAIRHFREEFEYHVRFPEKIKDRNHFVNEPMEKVRHLLKPLASSL